MKKTIFNLVLLAGLAFQVKAQEANKFRFDIGLGYAIPSNGGGGLQANLEPKWTINDHMNVGLRVGIAAYGRDLGTLSKTILR